METNQQQQQPTMSAEELDARIAELFPAPPPGAPDVAYTPYALANLTSQIVGKYVREQMLYQYTIKGMIPTVYAAKKTNTGSRRVKAVRRTDAIAWVRKYASKQLNVTLPSSGSSSSDVNDATDVALTEITDTPQEPQETETESEVTDNAE